MSSWVHCAEKTRALCSAKHVLGNARELMGNKPLKKRFNWSWESHAVFTTNKLFPLWPQPWPRLRLCGGKVYMSAAKIHKSRRKIRILCGFSGLIGVWKLHSTFSSRVALLACETRIDSLCTTCYRQFHARWINYNSAKHISSEKNNLFMIFNCWSDYTTQRAICFHSNRRILLDAKYAHIKEQQKACRFSVNQSVTAISVVMATSSTC